MELNNNLGVKVNNAGESVQTTPSTRTEGSRPIKFTTDLDLRKFIRNLTEKELKYLQEQGYDITKMTEADVTEALMPFYASSCPETSVKNTISAPTVQSEEAQSPEPLQANVVSTVAEPQSSEIIENSTIQAPISDVKLDAKEKNYISPTEVKIDYNSDDMKEFDILPEEGKYACDFYTLPKEERENFFVTELAKKLFGEQWNSMSPEEQAKALETVEADLSNNVKSWKSLNADDKGKLALAFFISSDDEETRNLRYDGNCDDYEKYEAARKQSLNDQIEVVASSLVKVRATENKEQEKNFNEAIVERFGKSREAKKNLYANQLTYLTEKQNNGIELNEYEADLLEDLTIAKANYGKHWQRTFSSQLNSDNETSTFALMEKDEHYLDIRDSKTEQYYQNTNNRTEAEQKAEREAKLDWLQHQFENLDTDRAKYKKFAELRNNCHTRKQQLELMELCKELKGMPKYMHICDTTGAEIAAAGALKKDANGEYNPTVIHHVFDDIKAAKDAGNEISDEGISNIMRGTTVVVGKEDPILATTIAYHGMDNFGAAAATGVNDATESGECSVELQDQIYNGYLEKGKNKDAIRTLSSGIPHTDKSIRMKTFNNYNDYAVEHKDAELVGSLGKGISKYDVDEQQQVMKTLMTTSYEFDDETAQSLQKGFSDQIQYCHKDNQLALHDEIMGSRFEDVQAHAASNIRNYHDSVKAEAVGSVLTSGNKEAIQKVYDDIANAPSSYPEVTEMAIRAYVAESIYQTAITNDDMDNKFFEGSLTFKELSKLTPKERREYFFDKFEKLSPLQKLEMIKKFVNSNMFGDVQKRTIYTLIARSSLLKSMVDDGEGIKMLETPGMPPDAKNKVIRAMKQSTAGKVVEQRKDEKYKQYFEEEHIVIAQEKLKKYATPTGTFMKDAFTPQIIGNEKLKMLKEIEATMYYNS